MGSESVNDTTVSVAERYADIEKRSGLSFDIVKKVLDSTRDSIEDSLKKGKRATIPGVVTFEPEIAIRFNISNSFNKNRTYIKAKPSVAKALSDRLSEQGEFKVEKEEDPLAPIRGQIITTQIEELA